MVPEQTDGGSGGFCANCSEPMNGTHCSVCGQRQVDLDRPFRDLAAEALESFFSFDTRILRTLWPLIRRPGLLTVEFLAGRRIRYVHPFKLYFTFSVLLFIGLAFSGYSVIRVGSDDDPVTGMRIITPEREQTDAGVEEPPQSDADAAGQNAEERGILGRMLDQMVELAKDDPDRLNRIFTDRLANSIVLLVPVFAALLLILYRRRRYIAHLVFSLHLHSFAFLVLVVGLTFDLAIGAPEESRPGNGVAVLVIAVYSFLALRRVYGQGRFVTAIKMVALLIGYLVALIATMMLTLAITIATV